jgi:hypothetical protein
VSEIDLINEYGVHLLNAHISGLFRIGILSACFITAAACSQTKDPWEAAVNTDTPDAYAAFLESNPKSQYAEQARARRDALIEQRDWSVARRENTVDSYSKYLSIHPEGVWSKLAARRRDELASTKTTASESVTEEVVSPQAPAVADPPPAPEKYFVQLGAFSSTSSAKKGWKTLQRSFVELADRSPIIDTVPLRGSSLYRLRLQLDSQKEVDRVCAALVRGGEQCISSE